MPAADGNGSKKPRAKKRYKLTSTSDAAQRAKPKTAQPRSDAAQRTTPKRTKARLRSDAAQREAPKWRTDAGQRAEGEHSPLVVPKGVKKKDRILFETDPKKLKAAGFSPHLSALDKIVDAPKYALGAIGSGAAVAEATIKDPIGVPVKTAKQTLRMLPAVPGGLYDLVTHPAATIKEQAKAFGDRGGTPYKERVAKIRDEGGLDYGLDAALVVAPSSFAAKGGLRLSRKGSSATRAKVRVTGDAPRARKDGGLIRESVGNAADKRRAAKHEDALQAAEAGGKPVDALVQQAAKANREAGRVVEVVSRRAAHHQRRLTAKQRGRAIYGFKRDQGRRIKAAAKEINKLNAAEKRAFYYATALGLRTAEHAEKLLPALREKIISTRERDGVQVKGSLKKSDMVPDIDAILAKPAEHFTPRLADAIESLRADSVRAGREDPSLKNATQRLARRYAPLMEALDLRRGEHDGEVMDWHYVPGADDFAEAARRSRNGSTPDIDGDLVGVDGQAALVDGRRLPATIDRALARVPAPGALARPGLDARPRKGYWEQRPGLRYFDESDAAFVKRLVETADELGLSKPLYFKSERYVGPSDFGTYALGGKRAMATDQRHKGVNLRQGLQDTAPSQYLRGLGRNIKRKHNWNLVADILATNSVKELSPKLGGSTVSAIRERMAQAGVDMNSVALWNPGAYRTMARDHASSKPEERFAAGEEFAQAHVAAALTNSVVRVVDGQIVDGTGKVIPEELLVKSSGWHAVPDTVLKELEAQMVPSHASARAWDIAKGKASRLMLLTANFPWLSFQVVSNMGASAAATGGRILNPKNWLDAHRWWNDMDEAEQRRVGAMLGLDATGSDSHQVRLGASTNSDLVNAYRALKAHPVFHTGVVRGRGPTISELNPLELMARADRGQNNIFRIAAGYSLAKREAVHRMGESMGRADRAQLAITSILQRPPREQLRAINEDRELLEEHADAVVDWMGDYTTMTAAERKIANRLVMFYPYLRYSLRLLFYTMPIKHPAVTAVLGELASMKADEYAELFGEESLPWNSGKIYFGKGKDAKSIDLRKANPVLNAPIEAAGHGALSQFLGIAPPWFGWAFDQMAQESGFTGKDWKLNGRAAEYGGPHLSALDPTRLRVLADDALGLAYPYRLAEKLTQEGPQGDDSTLFDERPTVYKGNTAVGKLQRKFGKRRLEFEEEHEDLIHELIPLLPQADRSEESARENEIIEKATPKPGAKKKPAAKPFGASAASGRRKKASYFGAGR